MLDKITMPRLASLMAQKSGKQKKLCEDFVRELFRTVADQLADGDSVRIKAFGTFKLSDVEPRKSVNIANGEQNLIAGHKKVVFVPCKELAAAVNLPFEAFEAVEIADSVSTTALFSEDDIDIDYPADEPLPDETPVDPKTDLSDKSDMSDLSDGSDESDPSDENPDEHVPAAAAQATPLDPDGLPIYDSDDEKPQRKHTFAYGFAAGLAVMGLIGGLAFWLWGDRLRPETTVNQLVVMEMPTQQTPADSTSTAIADTAATVTDTPHTSGSSIGQDPVPTQPSDAEAVYDTVSTTRYLTTIAKAHYGNFNLWPVIYEENAAILGHPDRIKPGTRVVVPPLSKYGVDPANPADIKRIKQKGIAIYSRYK